MKWMRAKKVDQVKRDLSFTHGIDLHLRVEKNGEEKINQKCHSFSRWANRWLINSLTSNNWCGQVLVATPGWTKYSIKDDTGNFRSWYEGSTYTAPAYSLPIREYFHFIRDIAIGESGDSWDYDQYHLLGFKQWANTYTVKTPITETDSTYYFELQGIFDITESYSIREVGLYGNFPSGYAANENQRRFLVSRDVLSSSVPVSPGDTISVIYRLTVG